MERVRTFLFKSLVPSTSGDSLSQLILRVLSFRLRDLRFEARNDPLDVSSKLRTGADIARTRVGRFCTIKLGEALKFCEFSNALLLLEYPLVLMLAVTAIFGVNRVL